MRVTSLSALTLTVLALHGNRLPAQVVLWDFQQPGSPPPLWTNDYECIPLQGCDEQQLDWQALNGKLVAPLYDANGLGIVNTVAISPVFSSVPTLAAGGMGGLGPRILLFIGFDPDALSEMDDADENTAGDELEITLETVGTSERPILFKLPFKLKSEWEQRDLSD